MENHQRVPRVRIIEASTREKLEEKINLNILGFGIKLRMALRSQSITIDPFTRMYMASLYFEPMAIDEPDQKQEEINQQIESIVEELKRAGVEVNIVKVNSVQELLKTQKEIQEEQELIEKLKNTNKWKA